MFERLISLVLSIGLLALAYSLWRWFNPLKHEFGTPSLTRTEPSSNKKANIVRTNGDSLINDIVVGGLMVSAFSDDSSDDSSDDD